MKNTLLFTFVLLLMLSFKRGYSQTNVLERIHNTQKIRNNVSNINKKRLELSNNSTLLIYNTELRNTFVINAAINAANAAINVANTAINATNAANPSFSKMKTNYPMDLPTRVADLTGEQINTYLQNLPSTSNTSSAITPNANFAISNGIPIPTVNVVGDKSWVHVRNNDSSNGSGLDIQLYSGVKIADNKIINNALLYLIPEASTAGVNIHGDVFWTSKKAKDNIALGLNGDVYYNWKQFNAKGLQDTTKTYNFNIQNLIIKGGVELAFLKAFSVFGDLNYTTLTSGYSEFKSFAFNNLKDDHAFVYPDFGLRLIYSITPNSSNGGGASSSFRATTASNSSTSQIKLEIGFLLNNHSVIDLLQSNNAAVYPWVRIGFTHSILNGK